MTIKSMIIRGVTVVLLTFCAVVAICALTMPKAHAVPGQCMQTPWGGFCDQSARSDGSWYHCENAMGFANCFYVRPVPVDVDARGWVPA